MDPDFDDAAIETIIERLKPALSPDARILRRRSGISGYRADKSGIVGQMPLFVLQPLEYRDVQAVCRLATEMAVENGGCAPVAVVARGGGTGLCGGAVPTRPSIVVDLSLLDAFAQISLENRTVSVQAGVTIARLNGILGQHGLFFPVTPTGAAESATVGGVISTNARGMYAVRYGGAVENCFGVHVVTADGALVRFGHDVPESSAGYDMAGLFGGAEGTLGIIVGATLRVHPVPLSRRSLFLTFDSLGEAARACSVLPALTGQIAAIELLSAATADLISRVIRGAGLPAGRPLVMVELHSEQARPDDIDTTFLDALDGGAASHEWTPAAGCDPWDARHRITGIIGEMSEPGGPVRLDPAVPLDRLGDYIAALERLAALAGKAGATCIFGHAGVGLVHVLLATGPGDLWPRGPADAFRDAAIATALEMGGTVSGEHGLGMTTIEHAARENISALPWMRAVKNLLDPHGIMNPGKVLT